MDSLSARFAMVYWGTRNSFIHHESPVSVTVPYAEKAVLPGLNRAMRRHSWKCHEESRTDDREQAGSLDRSGSAGVTAGCLWR
ncbi:MAG: hypothetical protein HXM42_00825 [Lautropia mirabilis]|nr:hypothetical protein [Lautropia mirabilis]